MKYCINCGNKLEDQKICSVCAEEYNFCKNMLNNASSDEEKLQHIEKIYVCFNFYINDKQFCIYKNNPFYYKDYLIEEYFDILERLGINLNESPLYWDDTINNVIRKNLTKNRTDILNEILLSHNYLNDDRFCDYYYKYINYQCLNKRLKIDYDGSIIFGENEPFTQEDELVLLMFNFLLKEEYSEFELFLIKMFFERNYSDVCLKQGWTNAINLLIKNGNLIKLEDRSYKYIRFENDYFQLEKLIKEVK